MIRRFSLIFLLLASYALPSIGKDLACPDFLSKLKKYNHARYQECLGFLCEIKERPEDDAHKLIFADFLLENEKPARAEFIRLQIEQAKLHPEDQRYKDIEQRTATLLKENYDAWVPKEFRTYPKFYLKIDSFKNGFISSAKIDAQFLLENPTLLKSEENLLFLGVELTGVKNPKHLQDLLETGALETVSSLILNRGPDLTFLSGDGFHILFQSPKIPLLKELSLPSFGVTLADILALSNSPLAERLTSLDLSGNLMIRPEGAEALAQSQLTSLKVLKLDHTNIGEGGAEHLAKSKILSNIEFLDLFHTNIGDKGLEALMKSPYLKKLKVLDVGFSKIGPKGIISLANSANVSAVERLRLGNQPGLFNTEAIDAFSKSTHLSSVVELQLNHVEMSSSQLITLSQSLAFPKLKHLNLSYNAIDALGATALAESSAIKNLISLNLENCQLRSMGVTALLTGDKLSTLESVNFQSNLIGRTGIESIATYPFFKNLKELDLRNNQLSPEDIQVLGKSSTLKSLRRLSLSQNDFIRDEGLLNLIEGKVLLSQLDYLHVPGNMVSLKTKKKLQAWKDAKPGRTLIIGNEK